MIIQISKQINKLTFLLIFLLIMAAGGFAQTKRYTLNGSVNDIENAGITNATVSLRNMASGSEFRTQTDSNGRFAFDGLVAGKFYLTVNAVGFYTV